MIWCAYINTGTHSEKVEPGVNRTSEARSQQISGLLTRANGQQPCVFSPDLLMQTMCDVTEKLVLLYRCGRSSNTCRYPTSALPLLSCFCACLNSPFFAFLLLFFPSKDLTRRDPTATFVVMLLREQSVSVQVTLNCLLLLPIMLTVSQQEQTLAQLFLFARRPGSTSLFVFFQALCLHFKRCCCIIHSWGETAAPGDWQVMCEMLWSLTGGWRANPG